MIVNINKKYKTRDGQDVRLYKVRSEAYDRPWPVEGCIGEKKDTKYWNIEGETDSYTMVDPNLDGYDCGEPNIARNYDLDLVEVVETETKDTSAMKININKKYKTRDGQEPGLDEIAAIDKLRFNAFKTNAAADVSAYRAAASKWFQGEVGRRLDRSYANEKNLAEAYETGVADGTTNMTFVEKLKLSELLLSYSEACASIEEAEDNKRVSIKNIYAFIESVKEKSND